MLKSILFVFVFLFASTCHAQEQYINLYKRNAIQALKRITTKDKLKVGIKQTDSTVVYVAADNQERGMVRVLYFDKFGVCNKVLDVYQVDSCYNVAFNNLLNETRFEWTQIMPGTYLSKFSKKLLLFENPKAPFSYILQHNKYMTRQEYDNLMPKLVQ